jgi:hypothetical protein
MNISDLDQHINMTLVKGTFLCTSRGFYPNIDDMIKGYQLANGDVDSDKIEEHLEMLLDNGWLEVHQHEETTERYKVSIQGKKVFKEFISDKMFADALQKICTSNPLSSLLETISTLVGQTEEEMKNEKPVKPRFSFDPSDN